MYIALARETIADIQKMHREGDATAGAAMTYYGEPNMLLLRDMENYYLYDPLKESSDLIEQDFVDSANSMRVFHTLLILLFTLICLGLYLFIY
jgi:hypothetical protein